MRTASVRTLAIWLAMFAVFAGMRALRLADEEFLVFRITASITLLILLGWLASILLRYPHAFLRAILIVSVTLLVIPVAFATWDGTENRLALRPREREAFEYLRRVETVQMPIVGFDTHYSPGFLAMRILGRSPGADGAYKELIRSGTPAAQLYGLIGVRRTDPLYFRIVAPRYASSLSTIEVFSGCVISNEPVASFVRDDAAIRLAQGETLEKWFKRRRKLRSRITLDITGGAYSSMFIDRLPSLPEDEIAAAEHRIEFTPCCPR